jgi:hypothetical protein
MRLLIIEQDGTDLLGKVISETVELSDAVMLGESKDRVLSECMDVIQATYSFMNEMATPLEILKASDKHCDKLKDRGHKVLARYELKEVGND